MRQDELWRIFAYLMRYQRSEFVQRNCKNKYAEKFTNNITYSKKKSQFIRHKTLHIRMDMILYNFLLKFFENFSRWIVMVQCDLRYGFVLACHSGQYKHYLTMPTTEGSRSWKLVMLFYTLPFFSPYHFAIDLSYCENIVFCMRALRILFDLHKHPNIYENFL